MIKIPLILASPEFPEWFFVFLYGVMGLPFVLSVISIVMGSRQRKARRSVSGIVLGIISISVAAYFHFSEPANWADPITYLVLSPFALGTLGLVLSTRKKTPNQTTTANDLHTD